MSGNVSLATEAVFNDFGLAISTIS